MRHCYKGTGFFVKFILRILPSGRSKSTGIQCIPALNYIIILGENAERSQRAAPGRRVRPAGDCQRAAQQRYRLLRAGRGGKQRAARGSEGGQRPHRQSSAHRVQVLRNLLDNPVQSFLRFTGEVVGTRYFTVIINFFIRSILGNHFFQSS